MPDPIGECHPMRPNQCPCIVRTSLELDGFEFFDFRFYRVNKGNLGYIIILSYDLWSQMAAELVLAIPIGLRYRVNILYHLYLPTSHLVRIDTYSYFGVVYGFR
jgi:hypothetical protein